MNPSPPTPAPHTISDFNSDTDSDSVPVSILVPMASHGGAVHRCVFRNNHDCVPFATTTLEQPQVLMWGEGRCRHFWRQGWPSQ